LRRAFGCHQLHVREVARHCRKGGPIGIVLFQLRKLEVRLDPEGSLFRGILWRFTCRDVKVGPPDPPLRGIETEHAGQRLEHGGLACAVRPEQERHVGQLDHRGFRTERAEVG